MPPPFDPQKTPPPGAQISRVLDRLSLLRARYLSHLPEDPTLLTSFGMAVLDQLDLRPADVLLPGTSAESAKHVYAEIGRHFLEHVLPAAADLPAMDAKHLTEYAAALESDIADPGKLAAAFGAARLATFGRDSRLVYRVGGYRGRPGAPLADYLIGAVVRPATTPAAAK
ncbi:hypothetical protein [Fimbriiglobus ruber]|uniref:Uncharacterized protein n=1 Tax=Fimbriiglobus ruber TaxID=1908690 RepID=A0A225DFG1_9BACT|nr:hypothetical protein [Fimbriiglobus ruber]OWK35889.1 hypothetical protein FRUB_08452 [Fimbriiglobus ruber]